MAQHEPPAELSEFLRLDEDALSDGSVQLYEKLAEHGTFDFIPYASGLFPASALPSEKAEATGMGLAWLRDNAHVAHALYEAGRRKLALPVGQAMLTLLDAKREVLGAVVSGTDRTRRLPVRVHGDNLAPDTEPRVQHDSTGYALWLTSRFIKDGALRVERRDLDNLAQTVRYLGAVEYWHDADEGHWEEDRRIHASSIGTVIAGLREARDLFAAAEYQHDIDIDHLIDEGRHALNAILHQGVTDRAANGDDRTERDQPYPDNVHPDEPVCQHFDEFSIQHRGYDAAMLFLVEPLHVLDGAQAERAVNDIAQHLQRSIGVIRYEGDTYWGPRFPDLMSIEERTRFAEGRIDERNLKAAGVAYSGTEAQWTLFDPVLSLYWGKRYLADGNLSHRRHQVRYLKRSLAQVVETEHGTWLMPEAYYHEYDPKEGNHWTPNDHVPLLWSQANLLRAMQVLGKPGAPGVRGMAST
jgi:phosphorylase kinase alpha/beta subunit